MSAEQSYCKIYDNKHQQVNRFIQRKKATGKSLRTLNSCSRVLREFYLEELSEKEYQNWKTPTDLDTDIED